MKSSTIKLSIIIPFFNGETYISKLVQDIIYHNNKKDFLYEIIIVNDGSSDSSSKTCLKIAGTYANVKYFEKENGGIASARNYGMHIAKGEYITFADQDDSILASYHGFLKKCYDHDLDMLVTAPFNKKEDAEKISIRIFQDEIICNQNLIFKMVGKLIDGKYLSDHTVQFLPTSVWNVLYKRSFIEQNNITFKSFIDYEDDWIFNIESLLASKKIAISSDGYYCWNIHHGSESHKKNILLNY